MILHCLCSNLKLVLKLHITDKSFYSHKSLFCLPLFLEVFSKVASVSSPNAQQTVNNSIHAIILIIVKGFAREWFACSRTMSGLKTMASLYSVGRRKQVLGYTYVGSSFSLDTKRKAKRIRLFYSSYTFINIFLIINLLLNADLI